MFHVQKCSLIKLRICVGTVTQFISWLDDLSGNYGSLPTTNSTDPTDLLTTWFLILMGTLLIARYYRGYFTLESEKVE